MIGPLPRLAARPNVSTGGLVRAVLDANVLVRFFLTPQGGNAKLLDAILADAFTLVSSDFILAEVADVLGRRHLQKFGPYPPAFIVEAIDGLRAKAHVVAGTFEVFAVAKDPKDNPVLACASKATRTFL